MSGKGRMDWSDHRRSVYQPQIHSKRIKRLHHVAKAQGRPMTVVLDEAVGFYLDAFEAEGIGKQQN